MLHNDLDLFIPLRINHLFVKIGPSRSYYCLYFKTYAKGEGYEKGNFKT